MAKKWETVGGNMHHLRPLTLSPFLSTVLILPDADEDVEEIIRGMFGWFEEVKKAVSYESACSSPA